MSRVILLGPQHLRPNLRAAIDSLDVEGPVATITAGWEEREDEHEELDEHVGREAVNLRLHERLDEVVHRDRELLRGLLDRRDELRLLRELYLLRLDHALQAARELQERTESEALLGPEKEDALAVLARLDAHHLARVREVNAEYEERWKLDERDALCAAREKVEADLEPCGAVLIAGGNVRRLLVRLRLFDIRNMLGDRPVVAWSAGAMTLTERIILFHDSPPQGHGNPEVFDTGLKLCSGIVALPHAKRRLRLGDPDRVSLFVRRFAPADCLALDEESRVDCDGRLSWRASGGTRRLLSTGSVEEFAA